MQPDVLDGTALAVPFTAEHPGVLVGETLLFGLLERGFLDEDALTLVSLAAATWGTLNWTPEQMERAWQIADREGVPGPTATQPPYSLVRREIVDDPAMRYLAGAVELAERLTAEQRDRLAAITGHVG